MGHLGCPSSGEVQVERWSPQSYDLLPAQHLTDRTQLTTSN
jgi:hypothetical protein